MAQKTFYYKIAQFGHPNRNLQLLVQEVFERKPKPKARTQQVTDRDKQDSEIVVCNKLTHRSMLCGVLLNCREGDHALAVIMDENADSYQLRRLAPPRDPDGNNRTEFAKHLLYFGIRENHMIVVQSGGLNSQSLESHLNWLLKTSTRVMPENDLLMIADAVPPEYQERPISGARSITLSTIPDFKPIDNQNGGHDVIRTQNLRFVSEDPLFEALVKVLKRRGASREVYEVEEAIETGSLEATLHLQYKGRADKDHTPLLDDVARSLRHADDIQYEIGLPNKQSIKSSQIKLSRQYYVKSDGGIPDTTQIFDRMVTFLDSVVQDAEVLPDP